MAMSGGLGTTPVGAGGAACLPLPGDGVAGSRPTQAPAPIFPMPFMGQIPQIPRFTGEGHAGSDSSANGMSTSKTSQSWWVGTTTGGWCI